jgi:argonaute-like protein implicated in RNA metabolism and viral defense
VISSVSLDTETDSWCIRMVSEKYTQIAVEKEILPKIHKCQKKMEEELKIKTGIRAKVTMTELIHELIRRYMKGELP